MKNPRVAAVLVCLLTAAASTARAQDTLARAKDFYASAAYEEALQVLKSLHSKASAVEAAEVAAYQVFCLVALGRSDEAKQAIAAIVRTDPLYHPSEAQVSPRVRAFFEDVRRPLLPEIVKQSYSRAKAAFDRKEMPVATSEFDRVIALIDEMGALGNEGVADLRTLADGFRALSKAAAAPPPAPTPQPPAADRSPGAEGAVPPSAAPDPATIIYGAGDPDVKRPVAISQVLPIWRPENPVEERRAFSGAMELVIGEDGKVLSAVLLESVHPRYDPILVRAAEAWRFRPATKNGKPVKYRYGLNVQLGR